MDKKKNKKIARRRNFYHVEIRKWPVFEFLQQTAFYFSLVQRF